jgi:hypothetical protein
MGAESIIFFFLQNIAKRQFTNHIRMSNYLQNVLSGNGIKKDFVNPKNVSREFVRERVLDIYYKNQDKLQQIIIFINAKQKLSNN